MLKSLTESDWIKFIYKSENITIYHHPIFLNQFDKNLNYKCFYKGNENIIGIPLLEDCDNYPLNLQGYNGFLFLNRDTTKKQKIISSNFKGQTEFAEYFYQNYDNLILLCDYTFNDARPFLWYNYPESSFYSEDFYTSKLNLIKFNINSLSESRRQDIKKSTDMGLKIKDSDNFLEAARFFSLTVNKNTDNEKTYFNIMKALSKQSFGKLISCSIKDKIISYSFFGFIKEKVFYMFSGENKNIDGISYHSYLIFYALNKFKESYLEFDFVGVNSPSRGSFKLSFGGDLNRCLKLKMTKKTK